MFTNKEKLKEQFIEKLETLYGKSLKDATSLEKYTTLGYLIKEYINKQWIKSYELTRKNGHKQVFYFSMEFLMGRLLGSNLTNLQSWELCAEALNDLGLNLNELEDQEPDAGLGNGGLGRLAACFLDSLASLNLPGHGCGIRYTYGLFEQRIVDGYQVELPDNWLREGNVWEIRRANKSVKVRFGGHVRSSMENGHLVFLHEDYDEILAVPYDTPIIGYANNTVNTLRLWSAETINKDLDFCSFNHGDYVKAAEYKNSIEAISQVLYPNDHHYKGKELRLKQQYFLVSAGVQSIIRHIKSTNNSLEGLPEKVAIHINDTHPALAIPELMRLLMDEEGYGWDDAWQITTNTMAYTNHTILAEALEKWPIGMVKALLPRIYMIIHEINRRFCEELSSKYPDNPELLQKMAIISDGYVKMAHLAIVGSFSVNGVAELHTNILKNQEMKDFHRYYPNKFNNKTNGITHRRWLLKANPKLSSLFSEVIGPEWIMQPNKLEELLKFRQDPSFIDQVQAIKEHNKVILAKLIMDKHNLKVDLASIFDVQVKRLHAYKRQILNVLHIMHLYNQLLENPNLDIVPRTFIFGAKAAPSYQQAKTTIKLINSLASVINNDKRIKDKIKVVFLENYRVTLAETIFPASDLSEQISTASKEASGTGNMKFMINGAVTIGTMDGANVEIKDAVGDENIFIFGLTAKEVINYYQNGGYCSWDIYHSEPRVKIILEQLVNGFLPVATEEFRNIYNDLLYNNDEFFVLKDFASYVTIQGEVDKAFRNRQKWTQMGISNMAKAGQFSSDRTIKEYAKDIWKISPL